MIQVLMKYLQQQREQPKDVNVEMSNLANLQVCAMLANYLQSKCIYISFGCCQVILVIVSPDFSPHSGT